MRIDTLNIEGFRSLRDVEWKPGELNVLIGPNASGKSNLLVFLEFMAASARGRLGKYVQTSGGMDALVWDGSADRISLKCKSGPTGEYEDFQRDRLTYELELQRIGASSHRIGRELLANYSKVEKGLEIEPFKLLERRYFNAYIFDMEQKKLQPTSEELIPEDETLLSQTSGPFTVNTSISKVQKWIASWSVYHDIHVHRDSDIRKPAVSRVEKRVEPDGQNLISVLHTLYTGDRDFKNDINDAMRAAFGEEFEELVFTPASDQRIQLRIRWKHLKRDQSAADLSDGTLRFLFLLTVLASPSSAPLIAIDEPETGLHPSMMRIVAEYAEEASRRSQVILTTHSPQFLSEFSDCAPKITIVKWENGKTRLSNPDGNTLTEWLKEYSLGDLYRSGELESLA